MGRFLSSAKATADEMERIANAAERAQAAVESGSFVNPTPTAGGNVTYNIYAGKTKGGGGGGGGGTGGKIGINIGDDQGFGRFLVSRGITAKHQLENSALIAVLRAEFEKILRSMSGIEFRKGGMS